MKHTHDHSHQHKQTVLDTLYPHCPPSTINLPLNLFLQHNVLSHADFAQLISEISHLVGDLHSLVSNVFYFSRIILHTPPSPSPPPSSPPPSLSLSLSTSSDPKNDYANTLASLILSRLRSHASSRITTNLNPSSQGTSRSYTSVDLLARGFGYIKQAQHCSTSNIYSNSNSNSNSNTKTSSNSNSNSSSRKTTSNTQTFTWGALKDTSGNTVQYNSHNAGAEHLAKESGGWEWLGGRLGGEGIRQVFRQGSLVFERILNDNGSNSNCYYQLAGPPLNSYTPRPSEGEGEADDRYELLPRHRIFYSTTYVKKVGFPPNHWIHGFTEGEEEEEEGGGRVWRGGESSVGDDGGDFLAIVFGKHFQLKPNTSQRKRKRKRKQFKPPNEVTRLKRHILNISELYNALDVHRLFDHFCPLAAAAKAIPPPSLKNLVKLFTPTHEVDNFVQTTLQRIIPVSLLGTEENLNTFIKGVSSFITKRRQEAMR